MDLIFSNISMMARILAMPGTNTSTAEPGFPTDLATCTAKLCCSDETWVEVVGRKTEGKTGGG